MTFTGSSCSWIQYDDDPHAGKSTTSRQHAVEQRQRAVLVERLVQVPALRALHAGGAAARARAVPEESGRVSGPVLEALEATRGEADPAGVAVVDEDRRRGGLVVDVRGEAADVPAVAHRPQRQERDERVLRRVQRAEERGHLLEPFELCGGGREPDRFGLEGRLR